MTWSDVHGQSERYAAQAEEAKRSGQGEDAHRLYKLAAEAEARALLLLPSEKERTFGITAVSAASLFFKASDFERAEQVAFSSLSREKVPAFAKDQLHTLLQTIWNERAFGAAGVEFVRGELVVSVAGGVVAHGAAPLELVHRKVDEIKNLYFRTVEMLLNLSLRRRGVPPAEVRDQFRPWIVQAMAGSYQFAVRVEKPAQRDLWPTAGPEIQEVTGKLLSIVSASSVGDFGALERIVPDTGYRDCFLKQTRNLAPSGKTYDRLEIKSAEDYDVAPVIFSPASRRLIAENIRLARRQEPVVDRLQQETVVGLLRGLQLDKDWLEVVKTDTGETVRVHETGEVIDDVVGPMVNHRVLVDVFVRPGGKRIFRDIQSEE